MKVTRIMWIEQKDGLAGPVTLNGEDKVNMLSKAFVVFCVVAFIAVQQLSGQEPLPADAQPTLYVFRCTDAPLEILLEKVQDLTGKAIAVDPGVYATFTLSTEGKITASEMIDFITRALSEQGIHLENLDEDTIRVRGTPNTTTPPSDSETRQQPGSTTTTGFSYADRRRARMAASNTNAAEPHISGADLQKHLAAYQQAIAAQGLPPLSAPAEDE